MTIRPALPADFAPIYAIWLAGIAHSFAGFAHPADLREQFEHNFTGCRPPFGFWVAEEAGQVLGWCSILPAFSHPLKRNTEAEVSTYVGIDTQKHGIGTGLMQAVFTELEGTGIECVWGFAKSDNQRSIRMCEKAGMRVCGNSTTKTILVREY